MITVTNVTVTSDLSIARVYLSIYNTQDKDLIIRMIKDNTKDIRYRLGQQVRNQLRVVPALEFFLDDTLDYLEHIDELLKK
jgi:ribosome-binding factor A